MMSILEHISAAPSSGDGYLWRYMSLDRFEDLLKFRSLFFARLENMSDPLEGHHARAFYKTFDRLPGETIAGQQISRSDAVAAMKKFALPFRRSVIVSCWYQSHRESQAMWRLYGYKGIVIRSSVERLRGAFRSSSHKIVISRIKYFDFMDEALPYPGSPIPVFYKDKSYDHEREVRAAIHLSDEDLMRLGDDAKGLKIPVDIDRLIDGVYLSPEALESQAGIVGRLLDSHGFNIKTHLSAHHEIPEDLRLS